MNEKDLQKVEELLNDCDELNAVAQTCYLKRLIFVQEMSMLLAKKRLEQAKELMGEN